MSTADWWTTTSARDLLELRVRLQRHVKTAFGNDVQAELEDIVQDAFVALYRHRRSIDPENDGLFRYLTTAARHLASDRLDRARTRREHGTRVAANQQAAQAAREFADDTESPLNWPMERVRRVFCALDELDRLILWSFVVEQKSIRTIARELRMNWHRVAAILHGSVDRIRREAGGEQKDDEDSVP